MGEKVKTLRQGGAAAPVAEAAGLDLERAGRVLPVLAQILGAKADG